MFLLMGIAFQQQLIFMLSKKAIRKPHLLATRQVGDPSEIFLGSQKRVVLPNSRLAIIIPMFKYRNFERKSPVTDKKTMPDYRIAPSINDLLPHTDRMLAFAVKPSLKQQKFPKKFTLLQPKLLQDPIFIINVIIRSQLYSNRK